VTPLILWQAPTHTPQQYIQQKNKEKAYE
jgi:hypothetical protein